MVHLTQLKSPKITYMDTLYIVMNETDGQFLLLKLHDFIMQYEYQECLCILENKEFSQKFTEYLGEEAQDRLELEDIYYINTFFETIMRKFTRFLNNEAGQQIDRNTVKMHDLAIEYYKYITVIRNE
jgi:hypothetical protein